MSLTIEHLPDQKNRINEEAQKAGITANELIQRTLAERFPIMSDEDMQALALVEQWISEAPADPKQQSEAEADLREFQNSIDQTRREAGARLLYPDSQ